MQVRNEQKHDQLRQKRQNVGDGDWLRQKAEPPNDTFVIWVLAFGPKAQAKLQCKQHHNEQRSNQQIHGHAPFALFVVQGFIAAGGDPSTLPFQHQLIDECDCKNDCSQCHRDLRNPQGRRVVAGGDIVELQ